MGAKFNFTLLGIFPLQGETLNGGWLEVKLVAFERRSLLKNGGFNFP